MGTHSTADSVQQHGSNGRGRESKRHAVDLSGSPILSSVEGRKQHELQRANESSFNLTVVPILLSQVDQGLLNLCISG